MVFLHRQADVLGGWWDWFALGLEVGSGRGEVGADTNWAFFRNVTHLHWIRAEVCSRSVEKTHGHFSGHGCASMRFRVTTGLG